MKIDQELTKREMEICKMLAKGLSRDEICSRLFIAQGTVKNHVTSIYEKLGVSNRAKLVAKYLEYENAITVVSNPHVPVDTDPAEADAKLRLVGLRELPNVIPLVIHERSFVIGRFDASVGHKQCDFEFGFSTRAVSRRHASIQRTKSGTVIVDLNSRAGTFVNGNRIFPGEPCSISQGDRVSFGNLGADYVFEG